MLDSEWEQSTNTYTVINTVGYEIRPERARSHVIVDTRASFSQKQIVKKTSTPKNWIVKKSSRYNESTRIRRGTTNRQDSSLAICKREDAENKQELWSYQIYLLTFRIPCFCSLTWQRRKSKKGRIKNKWMILGGIFDTLTNWLWRSLHPVPPSRYFRFFLAKHSSSLSWNPSHLYYLVITLLRLINPGKHDNGQLTS